MYSCDDRDGKNQPSLWLIHLFTKKYNDMCYKNLYWSITKRYFALIAGNDIEKEIFWTNVILVFFTISMTDLTEIEMDLQCLHL